MFWKRRTYLDYAAGARGNPSSPHEEGRRSREILEGARTDIARLLEVQADDVIFTSGATESNALAILGCAHALRANGASRIHILYLPSAHASIVENVRLLGEEGVEIEELPIRGTRVDTEKLANMLRPETALVAMEAVCGETGVVWNTREVSEMLKKFRMGAAGNESAPQEYFHFSKPGYGQEKLVAPAAARPIQLSFPAAPVLHVDASQAPLTEKMTRARFGADTLVLDGSKIGVRGIGVLVAHRTIPLAPLYRGGGQERDLRPGTESPEAAAEFADRLRQAARAREAFRASAEQARASLVERITRTISGALVNEGRAQVPNILNISLPGRDTDYLVALLDEEGFAVSTRSACEMAKPLPIERSPGDSLRDSEEGSRAVFALTGDRERARATLRVSWGPETYPRELACFARALAGAVAFMSITSH